MSHCPNASASDPVSPPPAALVIEPPIAALAARVATQADLDRITIYLGRGGASPDFEGFEGWDAKLHHAIAQAAHNGLLMNMFDVMNTARSLPVWGSLKRRHRRSTPRPRPARRTDRHARPPAKRRRQPARSRLIVVTGRSHTSRE